MKRTLDEIIDKCLKDTISLFEATTDIKNDSVLKNAQDSLSNYMKNLYKNGDKDLLSLMSDMGYTSDYTPKELLSKREVYFKNNQIADEVNKDALEITDILKKYTREDGGINFRQMKNDYQSDYPYIIRMKNFLDKKGLTYLYDKSANLPSNSYGIDWTNGGTENDLDLNNITDNEAKSYRGKKLITLDEAKFLKRKAIIDDYMQSKYGMTTNIPNIGMSNGNGKLPKSTLIVNFASALNCPAWNECLVKHACYARQGEKRTPTAFQSNQNRSLYWLATQNDPQLMALMMNFVRAYCFDYKKVAEHLIKNKMVKGTVNALSNKMYKLELNDAFYTPEIVDVMKMYKRIENIRLNENGDFVGQWLVDAWDDEAGKYQQFGVNVSAYTCRHLNYEGIKNIILNSSFINGKGNIARKFIAVPQDVYDSLDETYGGKNNSLVYNGETIKPNPQPLYTLRRDGETMVANPNGKVYYKCPCGREQGKVSINCYQCNLCYSPKSDNSDFYVFVAAHGSAKSDLKGYDLIESGIGVSKNFMSNYHGNIIMKESDTHKAEAFKQAGENGIKGITNNAVKSTYEHFRNL